MAGCWDGGRNGPLSPGARAEKGPPTAILARQTRDRRGQQEFRPAGPIAGELHAAAISSDHENSALRGLPQNLTQAGQLLILKASSPYENNKKGLKLMKGTRALQSVVLISALLALGVASAGAAEETKRTPAPEDASAYIVKPSNGETVDSKFKVVFGLKGMGVCPAGITADGQPIPNTGHHHLLVDVKKEDFPDMNKPLPADQPKSIIHFGGGQTETEVELPPGKHTLRLILGDYAHIPHDPPVISKKVTVTVEE